MGHVRVPVEIANPSQPDKVVTVEAALIDTGATRTTIPRRMANELGLRITGQDVPRTAAGPSRVDRADAIVRIDDRESTARVWVSDSFADVLIGVITLEDMGLAVDPIKQRLTDSEFLLL
jgi:clan AA aspartic protease